jgi:ABC-type transporter Mla subunit MlaD
MGLSHLLSSVALEPKSQILMYVPEAEAVRVGAPVLLDGMSVGSISKVELASKSADSNRRIEVDLRIKKRFQAMIRDDSCASLLRGGLLGDRYVNIRRGFAGPPINSGGEIRVLPVKELSLTDFIDAIGKKSDCRDEEKGLPEHKSAMTTERSRKPN